MLGEVKVQHRVVDMVAIDVSIYQCVIPKFVIFCDDAVVDFKVRVL